MATTNKVRKSAPTKRVNRRAGARPASLNKQHLTSLVEASQILNSTLDLDKLLELILDVARHQLHADRGTVWLVDHQAGDLQARVSQGAEGQLLRASGAAGRVKIGEGIAGSVAQTGECVRIEDAYTDPRFAQRFDTKSGFRTRSMLTMAIRSKTGEIIGVIQLLNKLQGTFEPLDEVFLNALTVHFAVALENAKLHAQIVDQQRIRVEIELARQIQQNLLARAPERWKRYRIAAHADTCFEVGGDFYDFLTISETSLGVVIADVSGKGVGAALLMATMQATLGALLVGVHSFERVFLRMNEAIRSYANGRMFITLFLAVLDAEVNKLLYINAGHNPPLLVRTDGSVEELTEGGTVLGIIEHVSYQRAEAEVRPGDVLLLYTDGLAEASNENEDMFGTEGLVRSVAAARAAGQGADPEAIAHRIMADIEAFAAGEPKSDDQTLLVIVPDK
jgi:sigma-B regulation protein RsbU (phosphoserine phosphatase)